MQRSLILVFILPLLNISIADAQRNVSYQDLLERSEQSNVYLDYISLPSSDDTPLFMVNFRIDYELLPFRRIRSGQSKPSEDAEFFSTARMSMEVFKGSIGRRDNFEPVTRSSWSDTSWASTFEQTRSRTDHLEGSIAVQLTPGEYRMFLDLNRDESARAARSRERSFTVPDFESGEDGEILFFTSSTETEDGTVLRLLNFGEYTVYGQNYQMMILLPDSLSESYTLKIDRLRSGSDSETEGEPLFEEQFERNDYIYTNGFLQAPDSKIPEILYTKAEEGYALIITEIPNSTFPNTRYRVSVTAEGEDEPVAEKVVNSRWIDMPVSLLNLDVAIDMLRFITDDDQVRDIRRGSRSEREARFREFWAERDPTPDTEFNELMAEYYSRIDYAYNNYTTPERPGFESDQGRAYILFGAPDHKERSYPPDGPTREVWEYSDRTLVFEATTGFGDFRLVQQR